VAPALTAYNETGAGRTTDTLDLGCFTAPGTATQGFRDPFWIWGKIDVFGLDANTIGLDVEAYAPGTGNALGGILANGRSLDSGDHKAGVYFLEITNGAAFPADGYVAYKVKGRTFVDTYQFGIHISPDRVEDCPDDQAMTFGEGARCVEFEANAIAETTARLIPIVAGHPNGGIGGSEDLHDGNGNGAIAGEVRDCDDDQLLGATVTSSVAPVVMSYFDGTADPRPSVGRQYTNTDGIYAAIDIPVGTAPVEVTVTAEGRVDGAARALGSQRVLVYPDSVTIYSFDGPEAAPHVAQ
jgi:hypothetical protein